MQINLDLISIIILLGIAQGIFLGLGLFAVKRYRNRLANRLLGTLLVCFSLSISYAIAIRTGAYRVFPHLMNVFNSLLFLFGPLFYFYVRVLMTPKYDVDMQGDQHLIGANYKRIGNSQYSNLRVWFTRNNFTNEVNDMLKNPAELFRKNDSREDQWSTAYDHTIVMGKMVDVTGGISGRRININYNTYLRADTSWFGVGYDALTVNRSHSSTKADAYIQTVYKPIDELAITGGVRMNYLDVLRNNFSIDPRLGVSYAPAEEWKLNASVGIYHQSPANVYIFGGNTTNKDLEFIKATQGVIGVEYFPADGTKVSVEGYVKEYTDYPVSQDDPRLSLANVGDMFSADAQDKLISKGKGRSAGVDFFVQQKLVDRLYGLMSYSYSRTKHQALDGVERPGSFDIPHVFTVSGGYKINDHWEVSSKFRYVSGRPMNGIDEAASSAKHDLIYDLNKINTERYPDYWRWDVRVDYRTYFSSFNIVAYFDIQNVTNRENVWGYAWDRSANKRTTIKQWALFPVGGVKVEF